MSEWKDISTAPKDGRRFLAPNMVGEVTICFWSNLDGGCWYDWAVGHLNGRYKPTHWMPLPPPPAPKGEG